MSNEFVVILGLVVFILVGGACTFVLALLRQNKYLKAEVQFLGTGYNALADSRDRLEVEAKSWQFKAYEQNQKFLLACPHLTVAQVEQIEKDIKSL